MSPKETAYELGYRHGLAGDRVDWKPKAYTEKAKHLIVWSYRQGYDRGVKEREQK